MREETIPLSASPPAHPLLASITHRTTTTLQTHWPFSSSTSLNRYILSDLPGLACDLFPSTQEPDRLPIIALLLSLLFLLDEELSTVDIDDGEEFLSYLREAVGGCSGDEGGGERPEVWMLAGVFDELRGQDYEVGGEVVRGVWEWLSMRNSNRRARTNSLNDLAAFRRTFVGPELTGCLIRFVAGLGVDDDLVAMGLIKPSVKIRDESARGRTRRRRDESVAIKAPSVEESEIMLHNMCTA